MRLEEGFNPTIDGTYLTESPQRSLDAGKFHNIDMMLGFNTHEGIGFIQEMARSKTVKSYDVALRIVEDTIKVRFFRGNPNGTAIVSAILDEYKVKEKRDKAEELMETLVDMYGDVLFALPSVRLANIHSGGYHLQSSLVHKFSGQHSHNFA